MRLDQLPHIAWASFSCKQIFCLQYHKVSTDHRQKRFTHSVLPDVRWENLQTEDEENTIRPSQGEFAQVRSYVRQRQPNVAAHCYQSAIQKDDKNACLAVPGLVQERTKHTTERQNSNSKNNSKDFNLGSFWHA